MAKVVPIEYGQEIRDREKEIELPVLTYRYEVDQDGEYHPKLISYIDWHFKDN